MFYVYLLPVTIITPLLKFPFKLIYAVALFLNDRS